MYPEVKRSLALICGFAFASLSWLAGLASVRDKPVPNAIFAQSIIDRKIDAYVKAGEGPKIFLVGGSSVAFGIDSDKIETSFEDEVVNFGCMAGIGPAIILNALKPLLSKGDKVLFSWEYGLYRFKRGHHDITYLNLLFGPQHELFSSYPLSDRLYLQLSIPFSHFRESMATYLNPYVQPSIYRCGWNFDSSGNVRSNVGFVTTEKELLKQPLGSLCTELTISNEVEEIISDFLEFCRQNDIEVLATWPNVFGHPDYFDNPTVTRNIELIADFWLDLGVPVMGNAEDSMLEADLFHDTFYHLNERGVEIRTEKLVKELRPKFPDKKPVR